MTWSTLAWRGCYPFVRDHAWRFSFSYIFEGYAHICLFPCFFGSDSEPLYHYSCLTSTSPRSIKSLTRKYLWWICFVRLLLDEKPFLANKMVDLLSWYRMLWETVYPWSLMKCLPHMIDGIALSIPTNSASVELRTFSFWPLEKLINAPCPRVIIIPVWPFKSICTPYAASTYQQMVSKLSTLRESFMCFVSLRYLRTLFNLFQSSSSGFCTLFVRNETEVWMSGRALIATNSSCATVWWNCCACSSGSRMLRLSRILKSQS